MTKETILSTGRAGMIGSRIEELTSERVAWDIDLDLRTSGVDITDSKQVDEVIGASKGRIILHLAAFVDARKAWEQRNDIDGLCYRVNVLGTRNVAEAAARYGKHLIHVSTDFVFDGESILPYVETTPRNPVEWYGETKRKAEEIVEEVGGHYTIMRIGFPYRAEYQGKGDYVRNIQNGLRNGTLPPQFQDNTTTPTFVDDIARAVEVIAIERPEGIIHMVGSSPLSSYELARKVARLIGIDPDLVKEGSFTEYFAKAGRQYPQHLYMSNALAKQQLNIDLKDIDAGLAELVYQQQKGLE